ncbi:hypothetical protein PVAG01_05132 [Phlyctema vagabunda]|uniref:DUF6697 domain-containing protein n=1 Tax=Phlyctema vagabunda TaxID=108571 RepID=A0ABR4PJA5_9HELO
MAEQSLSEVAELVLANRREERLKQDRETSVSRSNQAEECREQWVQVYECAKEKMKAEWKKEDRILADARAREDKEDFGKIVTFIQASEREKSQAGSPFQTLAITRKPSKSGTELSGAFPLLSNPLAKRANDNDLIAPAARRKFNDLVQRPSPSLEGAALPIVVKDGLRKLKEMVVFDESFLALNLNYEPGSHGWVIPYKDTSTRKQIVRTQGAFWIIDSSRHIMAPAEVGDHGFILQFEKPLHFTQVVPVFIGERQNSGRGSAYWYAGEYSSGGGVQLTLEHTHIYGSLRYWSGQIAKLLRDGDAVVTEKFHAVMNAEDMESATRDQVLKLITPTPNEPAKLPIYGRILTFERFSRTFYGMLNWACENENP